MPISYGVSMAFSLNVLAMVSSPRLLEAEDEFRYAFMCVRPVDYCAFDGLLGESSLVLCS